MKYLKLFTNFLETLGELQDDEVGRLFRAMLKYAEDGSEPVLQGNERFVWGAAKLHMDMAHQYSERKRSAGSIGGSKQTQANASNDKQMQATTSKCKLKEKKRKEYKEILSKESTKKGFTPPTVEEVRAYCLERGNHINAERFVASYQQKGWVVGKAKTPMSDWKAAVRLWETSEYDDPKPKSSYSNSDLERLEVKLI